MKAREIKNKYQLKSGDTIVAEAVSLPKLCKSIGMALSWPYKFRPKYGYEEWTFNYKGFEYQIITLD